MKRHRRTWSMNMNLASPLSLGLDPAYHQRRRRHCLPSYSAVCRRRSSFSSRRCSYLERCAAPCHVHTISACRFSVAARWHISSGADSFSFVQSQWSVFVIIGHISRSCIRVTYLLVIWGEKFNAWYELEGGGRQWSPAISHRTTLSVRRHFENITWSQY